MEEEVEIFGGTNAYRTNAMNIIGKPFDNEEYKLLQKTIKSCKVVVVPAAEVESFWTKCQLILIICRRHFKDQDFCGILTVNSVGWVDDVENEFVSLVSNMELNDAPFPQQIPQTEPENVLPAIQDTSDSPMVINVENGTNRVGPTMDAVVKVFCVHAEPNFSLPWQKKRQHSTTSSGFVIKGRRVLTNAHSMEHYTLVQLRKRGSDTKYVSTVFAIGTECDIEFSNVWRTCLCRVKIISKEGMDFSFS